MARIKLATIVQSQAATVAGVGTAGPPSGNLPPIWPEAIETLVVPIGGSVSAARASDPEGATLVYTREGGTAPASVTVSTGGAVLVASGTPAGTYTVDVGADDLYQSPVVSFSLKSPQASSAAPWTFGHAFKQGDVPSGSYLIGPAGVSFQADVRNRWGDGSVKYAVISGQCSLAADIARTLEISQTTSAPTGALITLADLQARAPQVVLAFGPIFTSPTQQSAPAHSVTLASVLSGAAVFGSDPALHTSGLVRSFLGRAMSEFHFYAKTQDPHLRVWWYVRLYLGGALEIETVVENGWTNVAAPGGRYYIASLTVNGTLRGSEDFDYDRQDITITRNSDTQVVVQYDRWSTDSYIILHGETDARARVSAYNSSTNVMDLEFFDDAVCPLSPVGISNYGHTHHTKWSRVDWYESDPLVMPKIDGDYFKASKLLPNFWDNKLQASKWQNASDTSEYGISREEAQRPTPFDIRALPRVYSEGPFTGNAEQSIVGSYELLYFRDGFEESLWANEFYLRAEHAYATYARDENTGLVVNAGAYPTKAWSGTNVGNSYGVAGVPAGQQFPSPTGRPAYSWDDQHSLSAGYLHYLATGRWIGLEKLWHQLQYDVYVCNPTDRRGADAVLYNRADRGFWTNMRNSGIVATFLPDTLTHASPALTNAYVTARADVINVLEKRIQWNHDDYVSKPENSLGYLYMDPDPVRETVNGVTGGPVLWKKPWMAAMKANGYALGWELEAPVSAAIRAVWELGLQQAFKYFAGIFGTYATSGYNWRVALGPYLYAAAPYNETTGEPGPLYTDWATCWAQSIINPPGNPYSNFGWTNGISDAEGLSILWSGGNNTPLNDTRGNVSWHTVAYPPNAYYILSVGYDYGHAGCQQAWNRIVGASNFYPKQPTMDLTHTYPAKIIRPRTYTP